MGKTISIIIPVYKVEEYLNRCVQSVVDQTYHDLEVILVDDGSPDRCPQICDEWSMRDPRIKVIHQENSGVSAARNAGIRVAQGEYLYFVDSDDWIVPTLCEKVMDIFVKTDVDIVAFNAVKITDSDSCLGSTEKLAEGIYPVEMMLKDLVQGHINGYVWNKVFKRMLFKDIWFPNRSAYEDLAIVYKLFSNASRIYCMNEQLYFYYQRADSAIANINAKKLGELFLSKWEIYEDLKLSYPVAAKMAFQNTALSALRLYDRSVWERCDEDVYEKAMEFLKTNKSKIIKSEHFATYWMFYTFPKLYRTILQIRHRIGDVMRAIQRRNIVSR